MTHTQRGWTKKKIVSQISQDFNLESHQEEEEEEKKLKSFSNQETKKKLQVY